MRHGTTALRASSPAAALVLFIVCTLQAMEPDLQRFDFSGPAMGTTFHIAVYAASAQAAEKATDAAFQRARQLEEIFSDYEPNSELNRIVRAAPAAMAVSPDMLRLTRRALHLAQLTEGAFDPTCGPLTRLWRRSRHQLKLPPADRLEQAIDLTDWTRIELDRAADEIRLTSDNVILDYGGIAKGYAADEMLATLQTHACPRSIVRAGGDVRTGQPPPHSTGWEVDLHDGLSGQSITLRLQNQAVSTSGDLYQFVEIDGQRYSHIVSPVTGLGLTESIRCSVIAADATTSDALATALCILGPNEEGKAVVDALGITAHWTWQNPDTLELQQLWYPRPLGGLGH